jgi:hypothetical protein
MGRAKPLPDVAPRMPSEGRKVRPLQRRDRLALRRSDLGGADWAHSAFREVAHILVNLGAYLNATPNFPQPEAARRVRAKITP